MTGYVEYKMPIAQMKNILKARKDNKGGNQKYLCDYVQKHYGVLGTVVKVIGY